MRFVYHSFLGRYSDSPRAVHRALTQGDPRHEHLWLADAAHADTFPPGVDVAQVGTDAARAALEAADVLVANTHTELEWDKPDGLLYVQTWHGTPLKRIHWDVLWAPEGRLERLSLDVAQWDVLLSPNAWSTPRLQGAFRFEGELLETGYPRNDVLLKPEGAVVREAVRSNLGLGPEDQVVLYAPTWRDDVVFAGGDEPIALELDAAGIADALGPRTHVLLRTHYMLTGRLAAVEHPRVHDVSRHPDVSDLYLAADVLITDYSSVMFDWAVTRKPILLFTYDLAAYRDDLRGFYFDLAEDPPGPLLMTSDDVLAALEDLPAVTARFAAAYDRFHARFCHLEDGRATDRVVARLLGG